METFTFVTTDGRVLEYTKLFRDKVNHYLTLGFKYFCFRIGAKQSDTLPNEYRNILLGLYIAGLPFPAQQDVVMQWAESEEIVSHFVHCLTTQRDPSLLVNDAIQITYNKFEDDLEELFNYLVNNRTKIRSESQKQRGDYVTHILKDMKLIHEEELIQDLNAFVSSSAGG